MKIIQIAKQVIQSRVCFIRASFPRCSCGISRPWALIFEGDHSVGGGTNSIDVQTLQQRQKGHGLCFTELLCWLLASLRARGNAFSHSFSGSPLPISDTKCPRSPSLDTPAEHTVGWTAGLKDSVSLTTSFFPVTKPRQMLMFFPMSLISCASLVVSGTIEILSSSVHSLPGFSHLFWHLFISSVSSVPSRVLSPLPMSVMVCWVNGSSYTHFPPCWIHYASACLQLSLLCQFFWLFLTYSGSRPWGSPRVLS